jgi:uncharacterized OsmC-like protein
MTTSKVVYEGGLRTTATHLRSGQSITTDAPPDNNGRGEAFSPTDLAATSLASCMMTIIGIAAEKRNVSISDMEAEVTKVMAANPRRISEIHLDLKLRISPDDASLREVLETAGRNCPVAKSLHPDILQEVKVTFL